MVIYNRKIYRGDYMPKVNKTRYAILGVLSIKPGSGYDIKKFCDKGISHFWNENFGHIYPVLQTMYEEDLITKEVITGEGKPSRNVYNITKKGENELKDWLMKPIEKSPARSEVLLKLVFSNLIPEEAAIENLERVKFDCEGRLVILHQIKEKCVSEKMQRNVYWLASVRYGIYSIETTIKWIDETIDSIRNFQGEKNDERVDCNE
jgi:PadR family transcriptional regulator, regulatory protein AphA